jgi:hypothetical protein
VRKVQVLATPDLRATFESAVKFISQFIDEQKSYNQKGRGDNETLNIAVASSGGHNPNKGGRGGGGRGKKGNSTPGKNTGKKGKGNKVKVQVTDRYYSAAEWDSLSFEERRQVRALREAHDAHHGVQAIHSIVVPPSSMVDSP